MVLFSVSLLNSLNSNKVLLSYKYYCCFIRSYTIITLC